MADDQLVLEQKSKFWWLWHNKFFESTPLAGYGFIHNAKRLSEVVVWYGLLIIFTGFTLNNVRNLINRYNSNPIRTEVQIGSNTTDAMIKNFTLKLKLPMAEIYESILQWDVLKEESELPFLCDSVRLIEEFLAAPLSASHCLLLSLYPLIKDYDPELLSYIDDLLELHLKGPAYMYDGRYCKTNVTEINQSITPIVETEQVLEELEEMYGNKLKAAWRKMTADITADIASGYQPYDVSQAVLAFGANYQWTADREGFRTVYFALYLLLSAMSGSESTENNLPFVNRIDTAAFFENTQLSAKDAIDLITKRLLDIAPFRLPPELNSTRMVLREWAMEFRDTKITEETDAFIFKPPINVPADIATGYNLFGESFVQEYLVLLPDGVKEFSVDIFPPKQLIEALYVIMHFDKHIYEKGLLAKPAMAADPIELIFYHLFLDCETTPFGLMSSQTQEKYYQYREFIHGKPRSRFLENFFDPLLDLYSSHSELLLDTGSGYITMQPFASYQIKYLPIGRIISQTDNCTSMDLTECVELCQSSFTLTHCQCIPWNMQYLEHDNSDVCHQPCPGSKTNRDQCTKECESALAHPCDQFMYRPEVITQRSTRKSLEEDSVIPKSEAYRQALTNRFKLFSLKINIEEVFTYSKTKETYEMSFTTFLSEFGGLVDFWLGVDVIGLIHAVMYFIKQFFHCGQSHKTGRTVGRLFGRDKIQQETSPDDVAAATDKTQATTDWTIHDHQRMQQSVELTQKIGEKRHAEMKELLAKQEQKIAELEEKREAEMNALLAKVEQTVAQLEGQGLLSKSV